MPSSSASSCTFVFVCQSGELEMQSLLLAATLRAHVDDRHKIVAAIPLPDAIFGKPLQETMEYFFDLDIEVIHFENTWASQSAVSDHGNQFLHDPKSTIPRQWLMANKIFLLQALEVTTEKVVFVDTDQICMHSMELFCSVQPPVGVRRGYVINHITTEGVYDSMYALIGATPSLEMSFDVAAGEDDAPLFISREANTSLICIDKTLCNSFAAQWLANCHLIDTQKMLNRPSHVGQVTFMPTVRKLQLPHVFLTGVFDRCLVHYHRFDKLVRSQAWPIAKSLIANNEHFQRVASGLLGWKDWSAPHQ